MMNGNWSQFSQPREGGSCGAPAPFFPTPPSPPCPPLSPCLIAAIQAIIASTVIPVTPSPPQVLSGVGPPQIQVPSIATPSVANAIYSDTTVPSAPNVWVWANGIWTEVIA